MSIFKRTKSESLAKTEDHTCVMPAGFCAWGERRQDGETCMVDPSQLTHTQPDTQILRRQRDLCAKGGE